MTEIDYAEVSRAAHELAASHRIYAAGPYAMTLAKRAQDNGDVDGEAFWKAVAASLTPR